MRLLKLDDKNEFSLVEYVGNNIPPYAILSHTWGKDYEEVTFNDLRNGGGKEKIGYRKLTFCAKQTTKDKLKCFWVDTCCIDKSSSAELSEAINSMFRWYRDAAKCYVYFTDISTGSAENSVAFHESRWFTRGWTLQELLAPTCVEFFSAEGDMLGNKLTHVQEVAKVTGISVEALMGRALSDFSVKERMGWASNRQTTREEDKVYSLLGIFDIHMPLIYGEGYKKAFKRLEKEIEGDSKSQSSISTQFLTAEGEQPKRIEDHRKHRVMLSPEDLPVGKPADRLRNTETLRCISQVSHMENEDLRVLLVSLQGQMAHLSNQLNNQGHASHLRLTDVSDETSRTDEDSELMKSIERLQNTVSLEASSTGRFEASVGTEDISSRELKRLCGILTSSRSVSLNVGAPRSEVAKKKMLFQTHKSRNKVMQRYEISIALSERIFSALQDSQIQPILEPDTVETITRVKILNHPKASTILTAYLHHVHGHTMSQTLHPVISVGRILPNNSPIFDIVRSGKVAKLKRLLMNRRCTLWDRNESGTPLLHYAMRNPRMCKFLVENGADIDEIACAAPSGSGHGYRFYSPPLLESNRIGYSDDTILLLVMECRRILLQAGADPTLSARLYDDIDDFPFILRLYDVYNHVSLRDSLDLGWPFINLEEPDECGHTVLLRMLWRFGFSSDTTMFKLLLDRGADIHTRDPEGRTCLHIALMRAEPYRLEQGIRTTTLLIQRGADVFATDNYGRSVTDIAYECDHNPWWSYGGFRGDLWDAALSQCNYGKFIRRPEDRSRHYTQRYTRQHFERLWKGREHLCPYFYDDPRSCPLEEKLRENKNETHEPCPKKIEESEESEGSQAWEDELSGSKMSDEDHPIDSDQDQYDSEDAGGILLGDDMYAD